MPALSTSFHDCYGSIHDHYRKAFSNGKIERDNKVGEIMIIHLLFANDLLIFGKATSKSAIWIKKSLDTFLNITRLGFNMDKSVLIFSSCNDVSSKNGNLKIFNMPDGNLLIKYLGLLLISSRLTPSLCNPILNKM